MGEIPYGRSGTNELHRSIHLGIRSAALIGEHVVEHRVAHGDEKARSSGSWRTYRTKTFTAGPATPLGVIKRME